ncbi:PolC-type DNA polymerase III [Leptotrichia sp. oral taxon 847]|uniref:PolC-type DNA polymerase III n=1 Tax=Leptotrichia sp. oral taxon 847 TaxID=1785996 RepID=UPI000767FDF3|nr:PolC-type DNA polymerase III [Leptotrichia sp. oral taxon 847]AMD94705.1 DNA polymerase III subunit alpha [Leptotrichia sp. oral taxon 847]
MDSSVKEEKYRKIKPSNGFLQKYNMKSFEIKFISLFALEKKSIVSIVINDYSAAIEEISRLKSLIRKKDKNTRIEVKFDVNDELILNDVKGFITFVIEYKKTEKNKYVMYLTNYEIEILEDIIYLEVSSLEAAKEMQKEKLFRNLGKRISKVLKKDLKIEIVGKNSQNNEGSNRQSKNVLVEEILPENIKKIETNEKSTFSSGENNFKKSEFRKNRTKIKNPVKIQISDLEDLEIENRAVEIEGKIFKVDVRETKNKTLMYDFLVTDYNDSIGCRIFLNPKDEAQVAILKVDDWVKVVGYYEEYNGEKYIRVQDLEAIESKDEKKEDNASKKRVELHAHTNMSEMSGVMSIKDYAKRAKEFGHSAIAVTDFGVVHSFPFAFKEADENFKIIYGVEAYVVDDEAQMITNPKDMGIEEETYVVFDIETTGFDPFNDKIIEIGAVKMKGKKIIGEFSEFVNPKIPIPEEIVKLTSITDEMVKDAPDIKTILPKFLEFCGDSTVVAHNAKFDVGFIKQKSSDQNLEFSPSVVDTLPLARALLTKEQRFGLANLTKYFGITLESHHRAIDDARATAEVFQKFFNMIITKGILTLKDINMNLQPNIQNAEILNTMILVKNQKGLRDLYELISKSHIDYFGMRKPRIPKTLLKQMRENLLLASSATGIYGNRGELINLYLRGETEEIEEKAKFYDYIEIHPPITYNELVEKNTSEIENLEVIKEMNKYFYDLGKRLGKIVVATGDVHYLDKREAINRNVLLLGSGNLRKTKFVDGSRYEFFDRELYFRTTEEMLEEFKYLGDEIANEIVVKNTNKIADMIDAGIRPVPEGFYPPKIKGAEELVRKMTYDKLEELYGNDVDQVLKERLEKELNSIIGNGFSVLYLIAQILVKKSVRKGYLVGSRGSVGSSIVAYLMGITEVNGLYPHYRCPKCKHTEFMNEEGDGVDYPDKNCPKCGTKYIKDGHAIPFEVFMGFNGEKVPDIDLNFSGEYQGKIHKYTEWLFNSDALKNIENVEDIEKIIDFEDFENPENSEYPENSENVFRAGTISTLAEKNAFGYVKKYLEESEGTENIKERKAEVTRLAMGCEGARKTTGQHPGGMIVVPKDKSIYDFCPVQRPANDMNSTFKTTHFDYHVMDEQLVKLDILGHDDPTTLRILQDLTGVDIYKIPLDDKRVMSLFSGTEALGVSPDDIGSPTGTSGIPEFGTSFVKKMLVDTRPKTFAELVRISGLSHGTDVWLNNAQDYVRSGVATLSQIITVRDDIMNKLIDDGLDKSLAFKIMEFVRKGRPTKDPDKWKEYSALMKEKGVEQWYIDSCEKIKYMFPKGHAVAYVMMAVRIAYFKVHYPVEFYTAFLNRKVGDFKMTAMFFEKKKSGTEEDSPSLKKIKNLRKKLESNPNLNAKQKQELFLYEILIEMNYRNIELAKPNVLTSDAKLFTITEDKKIQLPLIAVDGLGESVAEKIVSEREKDPFLSLEDLTKRTKLNKTVLKILEDYECVEGIQKENQGKLF